jgi:DNA-binding transcriptional regulator YdaS (Cro superfamily)
MLQSMAVCTGQVPAVAADHSDLARILGVSRSSINRWRKLKVAPKPDAGGFRSITPSLQGSGVDAASDMARFTAL